VKNAYRPYPESIAMLASNERGLRATTFEILASPDPAVPHRVLDQFTNLNLFPARFTVRRANAVTASIHVAFEGLDGIRARRIGVATNSRCEVSGTLDCGQSLGRLAC
jgi:hypothetical protein